MDSDIFSTEQYSLFKDTLARHILTRLAPQDGSGGVDVDGAEIDEFVSYLAEETWPVLPPTLRAATHESRSTAPDADTVALDATPAAFAETLVAYALVPDAEAALALLRKVVCRYATEACAPPPVWESTRTAECEICERDVPLTYHHLIPRATHAKVLKQGWHPESMINSVAWLCRPCHSAVHGVATNETLAREFYTVELLLAREDIQKWKKYAAKQRFGISGRFGRNRNRA